MGPQGPLARTTDTAADARYYLYDGLGSVVGEVDVNGNVTSAKKFDVYGATRATTGTAKSRQGWVGGLGHQTDPDTGYTYMRARYYDPQTGRFASEDPALHGGNWFAYCGNDPVNKVDESGKSAAAIMELVGGLLYYYLFSRLGVEPIFGRLIAKTYAFLALVYFIADAIETIQTAQLLLYVAAENGNADAMRLALSTIYLERRLIFGVMVPLAALQLYELYLIIKSDEGDPEVA